MKLPYYQVDAFTDRAFSGNPAGVCLLEQWFEATTLQRIAAENNLSETAFLVPRGQDFELRWFTPAMEVDLCGHATLAPAFVLFTELKRNGGALTFHTSSGELHAEWDGTKVMLDFPARPGKASEAPPALMEGLGYIPREVRKSRDYLAVLESQDDVRSLAPDFPKLATLDCLGVIATAAGKEVDFVSRFFAPGAGLNEDPVTGSAHCTLIPYWAEKLGKQTMIARQLSQRGGAIYCENRGERVGIGGHAVLFSRAELLLPDSIV
jgi:predicted PhzF superfamily epimerase YddE/YHI9